MGILNRNTILDLSRDNNIKLLGPEFEEKFLKGCSYDLRIGTIFKSHEIISVDRKNDKIIDILPSEIITMLTYEVVNIPLNICGTVYPINGKSSVGLLILNPGHIDPGFNGPISICAINLSNDIIRLSLKDPIFTILFNELNDLTSKYENANPYTERISYENWFFKNRASKLSPSIFDSIVTNQYVPYLKKQIEKVTSEWLKKITLKFGAYALKSFPIVAAVCTIILFFLKFQSCNNTDATRINQLIIEKDLVKILNESYKKEIDSLKRDIIKAKNNDNKNIK
ncbi:MAG: hypothetical protein LWX07_11895 [Bacteroidetes bacterium]|nr:hypothetical protein [Bacteroidota bacterium]